MSHVKTPEIGELEFNKNYVDSLVEELGVSLFRPAGQHSFCISTVTFSSITLRVCEAPSKCEAVSNNVFNFPLLNVKFSAGLTEETPSFSDSGCPSENLSPSKLTCLRRLCIQTYWNGPGPYWIAWEISGMSQRSGHHLLSCTCLPNKCSLYLFDCLSIHHVAEGGCVLDCPTGRWEWPWAPPRSCSNKTVWQSHIGSKASLPQIVYPHS